MQQLAGARAHIQCSAQQGGRRVDLHALLAGQPEGTAAYMCGPASMIDDAKQAAAALGWDAGRICGELFTPPPGGEKVGFQLQLKGTGLSLQVGRHSSILEAMTAAGLHPLFGCGRGEYGLCPLPVVEAEGSLQHRARYLSDEEKAVGGSVCICVSRVRGPRLMLDA